MRNIIVSCNYNIIISYISCYILSAAIMHKELAFLHFVVMCVAILLTLMSGLKGITGKEKNGRRQWEGWL